MKCLAFCMPLLSLAPLLGCAGYPAPQQHITDSVAAVRAAEALGAAAQPQAALQLRLAQEEIARAKTLLDDGKNEQADFMSLRAKVDADLARVLTQEEAARNRAAEGESKVQAVESGARVLPPPVTSPVLPASPSTVTPSTNR